MRAIVTIRSVISAAREIRPPGRSQAAAAPVLERTALTAAVALLAGTIMDGPKTRFSSDRYFDARLPEERPRPSRRRCSQGRKGPVLHPLGDGRGGRPGHG